MQMFYGSHFQRHSFVALLVNSGAIPAHMFLCMYNVYIVPRQYWYVKVI